MGAGGAAEAAGTAGGGVGGGDEPKVARSGPATLVGQGRSGAPFR
jgi:hypothetical protein